MARRKSEKELSITGVMQGNLGLSLSPNSPNLHQTQKQQVETPQTHPHAYFLE